MEENLTITSRVLSILVQQEGEGGVRQVSVDPTSNPMTCVRLGIFPPFLDGETDSERGQDSSETTLWGAECHQAVIHPA